MKKKLFLILAIATPFLLADAGELDNAATRTRFDSVSPANVKTHVAEKVLPPANGNSATLQDNKIALHYNFMTSKHDAILFDLEKEATSCARFALDVTGDAAGHRLALVLTDAFGEAHLVKLAKIEHSGPKHFDFDLNALMPRLMPYEISPAKWGGDKNMEIDPPVKKITIVLDDVPDSFIGSGTIYLENIELGAW